MCKPPMTIEEAKVLADMLNLLHKFNESQLKALDGMARLMMSADFIKTRNGTICYQMLGEEAGELVVMVHGFSNPKIVFFKNAQVLADQGYRVLLFDHFGRGYSDRPKKKYDRVFYIDEIKGLVDALKIKGEFILLGYSMGGSVVTSFASMYPDLIKKIILLAPLGPTRKVPIDQRLLRIPYVGDLLMDTFGEKIIVNRMKRELDKGNVPKEMYQLFKEQFSYKGFTQALLSSLKNFMDVDFTSDYKIIFSQRIPVLLIWGEEDVSAPYEGNVFLKKYMPHLQFVSIKGAGHDIPYSATEKVNSNILTFLRQKN